MRLHPKGWSPAEVIITGFIATIVVTVVVGTLATIHTHAQQEFGGSYIDMTAHVGVGVVHALSPFILTGGILIAIYLLGWAIIAICQALVVWASISRSSRR